MLANVVVSIDDIQVNGNVGKRCCKHIDDIQVNGTMLANVVVSI